MRADSSSFFQNTACSYYPCHQGVEEINCLFCYCPLYFLKSCPGTYTWLPRDGKKLKNCTDCTWPHVPEHYGQICRILRDAVWQEDPKQQDSAQLAGKKREDP